MDSKQFWKTMEHRISEELAADQAYRDLGLWCDGLIPDDDSLTALRWCWSGRAWVSVRARGQEPWRFEMRARGPATRERGLTWDEMVPPPGATGWLRVTAVDRELAILLRVAEFHKVDALQSLTGDAGEGDVWGFTLVESARRAARPPARLTGEAWPCEAAVSRVLHLGRAYGLPTLAGCLSAGDVTLNHQQAQRLVDELETLRLFIDDPPLWSELAPVAHLAVRCARDPGSALRVEPP